MTLTRAEQVKAIDSAVREVVKQFYGPEIEAWVETEVSRHLPVVVDQALPQYINYGWRRVFRFKKWEVLIRYRP